MRSLYLCLVYLAFLGLGVAVPFVATLGYVWVDTFRPQEVAWGILNSFPVSAAMGALAIGSYLAMDRRAAAPFGWHTGLTLLLAAWVTYTTFFLAIAPNEAAEKWDWAFKTIVFSAFIPLVIRSSVQIEAFLQVYLFALAIHILPFGAKSIIGGGGYGRDLGVTSGNTGFSEGSTLATVSLMLIPIIFFLRRHTVLLPAKYAKYGYMGMALLFLACALGTYARTALIGLIVLGGALWLRTDRKILGIVFGAVIALGIAVWTSDAWNERISTISDPNENSALGRVLVWKWTLGFIADHPGGGGFNSYVKSVITLPPVTDGAEPLVIVGKAFHSVYFEVLGEHGIPGALLYGGLILVSFFSLRRSAKLSAGVPEMARCRDLAQALQISLVTLLTCGLFIGVAFQPMFFYLFSLSACLANLVRRSLAETAVAGAGAGAVPALAGGVPNGALVSWRARLPT